MTNIRMKFATAATILGLGGLGGFAMASNPANNTGGGLPTQVASTQAGAGSPAAQPVVTGTSGAIASTTSLATQPVSTSKPVITHTSGAGARRGHGTRGEGDDAPALYDD